MPTSPYGSSKLMTEIMLRDASAAHGLPHVILRYFNVAGADPTDRAGQSTRGANHLIKVGVEAALGLPDPGRNLHPRLHPRWMTAYRTGAWRLQIMATSGGPRLTHLCLNSAVSSNAIGKTAEFGIGVRSRFAALRVSLSRARTHALTVGFPGTKSCEGLEGSRA